MSEENKLTKEEIKYFREFAKSLGDFSDMGFIYNPYMNNEFLKTINMNPYYQERDEVEDMVYDPNSNELGLRRLAQHLYNTQTFFKRMVHYYPDTLTYDWYPVPINATEEDMKTDKFKEDYQRMWKFFDKFNVKKEFSKIAKGMMLEDAKFTFLRESKYGITLQEMPSEYCMIEAWSQLGWLYSFNLMYFQQIGVSPNSFPKEFNDYYMQALHMKNGNMVNADIRRDMQRNGSYAYWKQINPKNGWVFKFHDNLATLIPPFLGLFIDAIEIDTYKKLQKSKSALEAYKIIMGQIPRHKDGTNKGGNSKDDFAISPDILGNYLNYTRSKLKDGVDIGVLPLDNIQMFEFDNKNSKNMVEEGMKNLYANAGMEQALFSNGDPNASTIKASTKMDASFVEGIYEQFSEFCTYHVNSRTRKFKFKIKFEGTIWDKEERRDSAMQLAERGIITPKLASANQMTLRELESSIGLMSSLGFPDKLKPLSSTHTTSGKEDAGRKEVSDGEISDSGEVTRDAGSNEDKEV